jgi:hypothetical protein
MQRDCLVSSRDEVFAHGDGVSFWSREDVISISNTSSINGRYRKEVAAEVRQALQICELIEAALHDIPAPAAEKKG